MSQPDDLPFLDASLGPDGHFEEPLRRVSYQPGMLLGLEATRAEQEYHRRRLTRHDYWLHGSGTVAGLRVSYKGDDPGNDTKQVGVHLHVSPGIGVDGLGREVAVAEPYCLDLGAWLTTQFKSKDEEVWNALIRDGYSVSDNLLWLKVTMRYQDCPSGLQPVLATEINAGTDPVQPSRIQDCVLFELLAERPPEAEGTEHFFAAHNAVPPFDEGLTTTLGRLDQKRLDEAAGQGRRQLEMGARLLHALGDDNQALLPRQAYATTVAELARTLLARVSIRLAEDQSLIVNPNRIEIDNLARPFLFNAATLANLVQG